jgi:hypothetical protein
MRDDLFGQLGIEGGGVSKILNRSCSRWRLSKCDWNWDSHTERKDKRSSTIVLGQPANKETCC